MVEDGDALGIGVLTERDGDMGIHEPECFAARDIAGSAGTTERTLLKHFGSKDGLVQAVSEKASSSLARRRSPTAMRAPSTTAQ